MTKVFMDCNSNPTKSSITPPPLLAQKVGVTNHWEQGEYSEKYY